MRSVFALRDFRLLWIGSLFSYICQWIQQATIGWVVYDITGSGALLGAVLGIRVIPMILLTPFAGVAADRYDRKRLLLISQLGSALVSAIFGVGLALGLIRTWHLFAFMLFYGVAAVLDRPARLTSVFELVPRDLATKAIAINTVGFSLMRIVGPACAGYLIAWFGAGGNFLIQAGLYVVSGWLAVLVVFPPRRKQTQETSAWSDLAEGLRYASKDATTRALVLIGVVPFFLLIPVWGSVLPAYAKDVLETGPQGFGMLLTAVGVGGTLGAGVAAWLGRFDRQGRVQMVTVLVFCAALVGLALSPSLAVALVFLAIGGGCEMALTTSNQTMLQLSAPEAMRGRISSLIQIYPTTIPLGGLIAGPLVDVVGPRATIACLATAACLAVVALFTLLPRLRHMRLSELR